MCFCYILHNPSTDTFYVGATRISKDERLERHLSKYYGNTKFTAKYNDWELFYSIHCDSYKQALAIETHIKKMKSKTYIKNLILYPEITDKLLAQYDS
jgi:putative endonuclease